MLLYVYVHVVSCPNSVSGAWDYAAIQEVDQSKELLPGRT